MILDSLYDCGIGMVILDGWVSTLLYLYGEPTSITMHMGKSGGGGGGGGRKCYWCCHLTIVLNAMVWPTFSSVPCIMACMVVFVRRCMFSQ